VLSSALVLQGQPCAFVLCGTRFALCLALVPLLVQGYGLVVLTLCWLREIMVISLLKGYMRDYASCCLCAGNKLLACAVLDMA
jgi:hypothetical protein